MSIATVGIAVLALWAADAGVKAPSDHLVLASGACPEPEEGSYGPRRGIMGGLAREALLPSEGVTTILLMFVAPSFGAVHALRLERPDAPAGKPARPRLRLVRTKNNFWDVAGQVPAADERALARLRKTIAVTRFQPVDEELVMLLEDVWTSAIARTQYVTEIRVAHHPDGRTTIVRRGDGTYHHLWHENRGAVFTEGPEGSAMADLIAVKDLLVQYVEAAPAQQAPLLGRAKGDLVRLRARLATHESCVTSTFRGSASH